MEVQLHFRVRAGSENFLCMFEDTILREDNILLSAIRHPIDYELAAGLGKQLGDVLDFLLSKDSTNFRYINELVQERPFHKEFPKKATSLDNEEVYVGMNSDFVVRWLPHDVMKIIFPAIYFNELVEELRRERKPFVEFVGGQVPTTYEIEKCRQRKGQGLWSRKGIWFCTCKRIGASEDSFGPKFFSTYNEWLAWDQSISEKEDKARNEGDEALVEQIIHSKSYTVDQKGSS